MTDSALYVIMTSVKFVELMVTRILGSSEFAVQGINKKVLGQRSARLVVDDSSVVEIAPGAFRGLQRITGVWLGDSIRAIGEGAFERCYGVLALKLPKRLKEVPARMCYFCSSLTSLDLPDVEKIGAEAFANCGLKSIYIPASAREIEAGAFRNCRLERVVFGASDVKIDPTAFDGNPDGLELVGLANADSRAA